MAKMVRVEDGRTVRRWEAGEREIPGPVSVLMETAMDFLGQLEGIEQQLEMLRSGKMRSGSMSWGGKRIDTTETDVARLSQAKSSLESALAILTRQPSREVNWYTLKRATPQREVGVKDEWFVPTEINPEAALAYFEKYEGFGEGLEIHDDSDGPAEFFLERREVLRTQIGMQQKLRAGTLIETIPVRRI
ncbi:MAG: hypothetical protein FJX16_11475 [Alphaproteobacteria bacterium]|nr:hypothetical protein [Alphaproteobacteria bacterium]MBM3625916.1 hypothetical protein [Alphaproteobacteria bacterium]